MYDFLTDRKSSILGVWAAPDGRETFQKEGGLRPPPFWKVSRPPGAAQTPLILGGGSPPKIKAGGLGGGSPQEDKEFQRRRLFRTHRYVYLDFQALDLGF